MLNFKLKRTKSKKSICTSSKTHKLLKYLKELIGALKESHLQFLTIIGVFRLRALNNYPLLTNQYLRIPNYNYQQQRLKKKRIKPLIIDQRF